MASLGIDKINLMLISDYADGKPTRTFRAEIDIPLGSQKNYDTVKALLDKRTLKTDPQMVKFLLRKLGPVSPAASKAEKKRHKAARHFLAAAFDLEPPKLPKPPKK
jgi:hypothetical protein